MTRSRARAALIAIVFLAHGVPPAAAQWTLGMGIGAPRFSGGAVEPATGRSLRPYRPTVWELGVDRAGSRVGVGLRAHYASSSLALEGSDALAAVKNAIALYGVDPELSVRIGRLGPEGIVRLFAGPLFEIWELPDAGSHLRVGLAASLGLEVPFGGRWAGSARIGAAVTPSPFAREDLDESLEPRTLWRREAAAGVRYRL
jgi:hypothetical protein